MLLTLWAARLPTGLPQTTRCNFYQDIRTKDSKTQRVRCRSQKNSGLSVSVILARKSEYGLKKIVWVPIFGIKKQ